MRRSRALTRLHIRVRAVEKRSLEWCPTVPQRLGLRLRRRAAPFARPWETLRFRATMGKSCIGKDALRTPRNALSALETEDSTMKTSREHFEALDHDVLMGIASHIVCDAESCDPKFLFSSLSIENAHAFPKALHIVNSCLLDAAFP